MDYNIYIRNIGDRGDPISPWKPSEGKTTAWGSEAVREVEQSVGIASNPSSLLNMGIGYLKKAIPAIGLALLVTKAASAVFQTSKTLTIAETGDYRMGFQASQARQVINNIFSPFSSVSNSLRAEQSYKLDEQRKDQTASLLGDSTINQMRRGV